jgi:hypothetical protein
LLSGTAQFGIIVVVSCGDYVANISSYFIKKVKQSRYRPGVALRVPGS